MNEKEEFVYDNKTSQWLVKLSGTYTIGYIKQIYDSMRYSTDRKV